MCGSGALTSIHPDTEGPRLSSRRERFGRRTRWGRLETSTRIFQGFRALLKKVGHSGLAPMVLRCVSCVVEPSIPIRETCAPRPVAGTTAQPRVLIEVLGSSKTYSNPGISAKVGGEARYVAKLIILADVSITTVIQANGSKQHSYQPSSSLRNNPQRNQRSRCQPGKPGLRSAKLA